jgi:23S rRNA pseudouridine2605 synthase
VKLNNLNGVTVDGKAVAQAEAPRLFAFHKPSGLITAERDPKGRPTIYTALRNALPKNAGRVMPVGRLDFNTEGLLLLTNDGEMKRAMELPSSGIPRTYRARAFGDITQAQLDELIEGIEIDGIRYGRIEADLERGSGKNRWVQMTLTEGKNREVRLVLEHLGLQVNRLLRVGYGPFELGELARGQAVEIRQADVERFRKQLTRARKLTAPPGEVTRPTADRTRETLFNMLASRLGSFEGVNVVDLFAGSGALGLEALSRGAASCLFVEQDADAVKSIRKNIETLDARTRTTVQQASVMSLGPAKAPHDLILLDPPYDTGAGHVAIDRLTRLGWIGPATWVALETGAREERELRGLEVVADRKMGKAKVSLLRLAQ